jgi:hypothetical protein
MHRHFENIAALKRELGALPLNLGSKNLFQAKKQDKQDYQQGLI